MLKTTLRFRDFPRAREQTITVDNRHWTGGSKPRKLSEIYGLERALVKHMFREQVTEWADFWKARIPLDIARIFWNRARYDAYDTVLHAKGGYEFQGMRICRVDYRGRVYDNYFVTRDPQTGPGWYIFGRSPDYGGIIHLVARPIVKPRRHPHYHPDYRVKRGWHTKKEAEQALKQLLCREKENVSSGVRDPSPGRNDGEHLGCG